jgi:hypothetical protein
VEDRIQSSIFAAIASATPALAITRIASSVLSGAEIGKRDWLTPLK